MTGSVALEEVAAPPDTDTPPDTPVDSPQALLVIESVSPE